MEGRESTGGSQKRALHVWEWPGVHIWKITGVVARDEAVGIPLVVQRLRLHSSTAGGKGLIPGQGTKILTSQGLAKKKTEREMKLQKVCKVRLCGARKAQ